MINRMTYKKLQRFVLTLVVVSSMSITVGFAQSVSSSVDLVGNRQPQEENCLDFYVIGMLSAQDAIIVENALANHGGIDRARANFSSRRCQVITLMGSNVNQVTLSDLLATVGFTLRNFTVRVINAPVEASLENVVHNAECEQNHTVINSKVTHSVVTKEQRLKQIVLLRKEALKNGTPTYKYDRLILELNQQIKNKGESRK